MGGSSMADQLVRCTKHPKHKQSPGVCSVCLKESLSRLYITSSKNATASSSSSSSYSSAPSISSSFLPTLLRFTITAPSRCLCRVKKNTKGSSGAVMMRMMRRRSRSIAAHHKGSKSNNNNKRGFWWKLLGLSAGKRRINNKDINDQVLMVHSNSR